MYKVVKYSQDEHLEAITSWVVSRKGTCGELLLSPNGYVVMHNDDPIFCAFVYFVLDVPVVHIDNVYSKPGLHFTQTKRAWQLMVEFIKDFLSIVEVTSSVKFKLIRCITSERLAKAIAAIDDNWFVITKQASTIGLHLT